MKVVDTRLAALVLAVGLALAPGPDALAFHDNGVARCESCHVMHDSEDGQPVTTEVGDYLLKAASSTELCLNCHGPGAAGHSVMSSDLLNPSKQGKGAGGGDFVFLLENNLNDGPNGAVNPLPGDYAGHNIVGAGLPPDSRNSTSPGGNYPSSKLTCTSCHDPHGSGRYRFLYGTGSGQNAKSMSMSYRFTFTAPAPVAVEMPLTATEADNNHNAYRSGMARWCGVCHGRDIHDERGSAFEHPGEHSLESEQRNNYNRYNGTLDPDNGNLSNPYLAQVPVEWNSSSNVTTYTGPIDSSSRVMCLSCHRAHASSGPYSGRWDFNITTWAEEGAISGSYAIENPYEASSGTQQRRLCEKCHGLNVPH